MATFYAKPYGGYALSSTEAKNNIELIWGILRDKGWTDAAVCGLLANVYAESSLNPWRWQGDKVNVNDGGYGLFQYTPASGYLSVGQEFSGYAPNMSVSAVVGGGVSDGIAQVNVFTSNALDKWVGNMASSPGWYWSQEMLDRKAYVLDTYGNGSYLSIAQAGQIESIYDATLCFLTAFERPLVLNYEDRKNIADQVWSVMTGGQPVDPDQPGPPTPPTPGGYATITCRVYTVIDGTPVELDEDEIIDITTELGWSGSVNQWEIGTDHVIFCQPQKGWDFEGWYGSGGVNVSDGNRQYYFTVTEDAGYYCFLTPTAKTKKALLILLYKKIADTSIFKPYLY